MAEDSYSIKEMISEFRKDTSGAFKDLNERFDIVDKRTTKLERKYWIAVGICIVICAIGLSYATLFVQNIAQATFNQYAHQVLRIHQIAPLVQ